MISCFHYVSALCLKCEWLVSSTGEWPIFYAYMIVDGVFTGKTTQVEKYQKLLKRRLCYSEQGDPLMPMYYAVRPEDVLEERARQDSVFGHIIL